MLGNGGMERPYAGGIANGWTRNCYGSNAVTFAEETNGVHGGASALRVTCSDFASGAVQFHSRGLAVEQGKPYTLTLWLKGDLKRPLRVCIRKRGEPYTQYLKRDVRVRTEWTPVVIMGEASGSDADCCVFLNYAEAGTLFVDDASLVSGRREFVTDETSLAPQKGNRLYNSGFEAGQEGWTPAGGFPLDETVYHAGRASALVDQKGIECRPFAVRAGRRYTLSAWLRSVEPSARVTLRFFEWADDGGDQPDQTRPSCAATVTVTNGWARYCVSGVVLPNQWDYQVARITPSAQVWVDDVQLEEGGLSDYAAARPVEVGAETATRWCTVGESVEVVSHVACGAESAPKKLTFTLEDFWGCPVGTVSRRLKGSETGRAAFVPARPGLYRVRVQADESPATGEVWFGVFPKRDRDVKPSSAFGTHVTMTVPEPTATLRASEAMGARWVRLHDFGDFCHWRVVEPEKGRFVWRDAEVDALRARGFSVLANLGHPPLWAGRKEPAGGNHGDWTDAPPRDPAEWAQYVFKTVEHFRGRIRHWEVWNEPCWETFFSGTPEEYAELLRIAYREIKRADPQAVVIGGCFSSHAEAWTQRVLAQGAMDAMDALSYHVYWSPPLTEAIDGGDPEVARQVNRFIGLMRERGAVKPIYMTEGGVRCPPFASWLPKEGFSRGAAFGSASGTEDLLTGAEAASALVRGMVQMLSAGVVNVCYYYTGGAQGAMPWFSTMANGYYVMTDYDGRPKPTMMAYSALELMLGDAKPVRVIARNGLTLHLFACGDKTVAVAWSDTKMKLDLPRRVTAFDLMGNEMRRPELRAGEPAYLRAPAAFGGWDAIGMN